MSIIKVDNNSSSPLTLDNSKLLSRTCKQSDLYNCTIISITNIIEAKYWQYTGRKLQIDYDALGETSSNTSLSLEESIKLFQKNKEIKKYCTLSNTMLSYKYYFKNKLEFISNLQHLLHKYTFAVVGVTPIKNVCTDNHAMTACGYTDNNFLLINSYNPDIMTAIDYTTLYKSTVAIAAFNVIPRQ